MGGPYDRFSHGAEAGFAVAVAVSFRRAAGWGCWRGRHRNACWGGAGLRGVALAAYRGAAAGPAGCGRWCDPAGASSDGGATEGPAGRRSRGRLPATAAVQSLAAAGRPLVQATGGGRSVALSAGTRCPCRRAAGASRGPESPWVSGRARRKRMRALGRLMRRGAEPAQQPGEGGWWVQGVWGAWRRACERGRPWRGRHAAHTLRRRRCRRSRRRQDGLLGGGPEPGQCRQTGSLQGGLVGRQARAFAGQGDGRVMSGWRRQLTKRESRGGPRGAYT